MAVLIEDPGTIIAAAVLIAVVIRIVFMLIRDKRKASFPCGCGCAHCERAGRCHEQ